MTRPTTPFGGSWAKPTISSFTLLIGPFGTTVTINGTGFLCTTAVTFGGFVATDVPSAAQRKITVVVPNTALTGRSPVTTPGGTATASELHRQLTKQLVLANCRHRERSRGWLAQFGANRAAGAPRRSGHGAARRPRRKRSLRRLEQGPRGDRLFPTAPGRLLHVETRTSAGCSHRGPPSTGRSERSFSVLRSRVVTLLRPGS
jgi:hypothetical protein